MSNIINITLPDIGDFKDVPVIELPIKPGDHIQLDDTLLVLESDKATIDVPSPAAGKVIALHVAVGDRLTQGDAVLQLEPIVTEPAEPTAASQNEKSAAISPDPSPAASAAPQQAAPLRQPIAHEAPMTQAPGAGPAAHASPSVRRLARELGVELQRVQATGPKGRILQEDIKRFVKQALSQPASTQPGMIEGLELLPWPTVDFSKFGPTRQVALSRIRKISGANLARNAMLIPHVTNTDEADITELENFRVQLNAEQAGKGTKVTLLAFLIKAVTHTLQAFPDFNSSLVRDENNEPTLVLKEYYNIGFAADTPNGLVVPVLHDADKKGLLAIATECAELAAKARDGKLSPADMNGGTFTISSLGGVGGTGFSPIINAPEVSILGVTRACMKPVWDGNTFIPRLTLPMSLSWDHRVVDGVAAARFLGHLAQLLTDLRRAQL